MQEHAIPQNITGFQFKLIGFLTIRQFAFLAGGGGLAFFILIAVDNFILKWVLIFISGGTGLAFAFLPVNGMPLDRWILVFTQAVVAPSRRIWKKEPKIIGYFGPEFNYYLRRAIKEKPDHTADRSKLDALVNQIKQREQHDELDLQHRAANIPTKLAQMKGERQ